jgi:hypothetical protein
MTEEVIADEPEEDPGRLYVLVDANGMAVQIMVPSAVRLVPPFSVFEAEKKTNTGLILPPQ